MPIRSVEDERAGVRPNDEQLRRVRARAVALSGLGEGAIVT